MLALAAAPRNKHNKCANRRPLPLRDGGEEVGVVRLRLNEFALRRNDARLLHLRHQLIRQDFRVCGKGFFTKLKLPRKMMSSACPCFSALRCAGVNLATVAVRFIPDMSAIAL